MYSIALAGGSDEGQKFRCLRQVPYLRQTIREMGKPTDTFYRVQL